MSNKRVNKAYVRYDGSGRVIPGSLILNRFKPAVGNWQETPAYLCCNPTPSTTTTTSTTSTTTTAIPLLRLTFGLSFPVLDPNDVSEWNTLLGSSFTGCTIDGLTASLFGSPGFTLPEYCLSDYGLISIIDEGSYVLGGQQYCLAFNAVLTTVSLPAATTFLGGNHFENAGVIVSSLTFYLPACTQLGATVFSDGVFNAILAKTVTLTVPASLMTCNSGNPDGDIQVLQVNNTVTVIIV